MIKIVDNKSCCGCNACGDICQHEAISFHVDNEGFQYPKVDIDRCVDCGLCDKVCPMLHSAEQVSRYSESDVYAAYANDRTIRIDSTSGGIQSVLASQMYEQSAFVGGAVYNPDHTVSQIISDDPLLLPALRSSKYLQSDASGVYAEIRRRLKEGREVLFCGTPCQIHALYNYLQQFRLVVSGTVEHLTTIDFICRGVNSPKVFLSYMEMLEKKFGAKAEKIKFKAKQNGWHNFSMYVRFANGKEYCQDRWHDLFFIGYLQCGTFARPSCYHCPFKGFPQKSDITLADFWGIEKVAPEMDQDLGTSLVMVNSDKGQSLFESIKPQITWKQCSLSDARKGNPAMDAPLKETRGDRAAFFQDLDCLPFSKVAKRHFPSPPTKLGRLQQELYKRWRPMQKKLQILTDLGLSFSAWREFLWINFASKQVVRGKALPLRPKSHSIIQLDHNAKLMLKDNLLMGAKQVRRSKMETRLLLEENASMEVLGEFKMFAGSYIRVIKGGKLIVHDGMINENVQITCGDTIEIGRGATIGRDVVIRSFDGHTLIRDNYTISASIKIGDHVWIGQGATILKGVTIGDGAVIAAGALVSKDVPAKSLVAGVPARVIQEQIEWKR